MRKSKIRKEHIQKYSGQIRTLDGLIPHLKRSQIIVETGQVLTGDAPKVFLRQYVYGECFRKNAKNWPAFIAKVGHKWYPVESIMEQLLTDLGKLYGMKIADSKLMIASGQLRFLSKYFLKKDEQLIHGAQIYAAHLNDDISFVEEIEDMKLASDFFTVSFTLDAMKTVFPNTYNTLFSKLLEMLTFDAITGNNDRHFYNWGVITNVKKETLPVFSPIYDTARALFWNYSDDKIKNVCASEAMRIIQIEKYGSNSKSKIGIEGCKNLNHFQLIEEILKLFHDYRDIVVSLIKKLVSIDESELLNDDYRLLLSHQRRELILDCLNYRKQKLLTIARNYDQTI